MNWESIISSIITSSITTTALAFILKGFFNNWLAIKLENHKSELLLVTEKEKSDYQKQLQDFSLFNTKRHEIYPHLYSLILEAQGYIYNLTGLRTEPDFTEYSTEDLKRYLEKRQLLNSRIDEFMGLLEIDPELANKEIKKYIKIIEPQIAEQKFNEARNYFLLNELYLSNECSELVDKVLLSIGGLIIDTEHYYSFNERPDVSFPRQKQNIKELVLEVKKKMREELSKSDITY